MSDPCRISKARPPSLSDLPAQFWRPLHLRFVLDRAGAECALAFVTATATDEIHAMVAAAAAKVMVVAVGALRQPHAPKTVDTCVAVMPLHHLPTRAAIGHESAAVREREGHRVSFLAAAL